MSMFRAMVEKNVERARLLHPKPYHSPHEALGVLREEYLEFEAEVFQKQFNAVKCLKEALDIIAVLERFAVDYLIPKIERQGGAL